MSKFDDFMKLMNQYMSYHGFSFEICSDMRLTSYSGESKVSLVDSDIRVMDMDIFAKKAYRKIILPDSLSEADSINTADAFLINKCD
jgi:hypothetical protein